MRKLLGAAACGAVLAVAGHTPATAYVAAPAHGQLQATVVTPKSLSATGPTKVSGWVNPGDAVPVTATITNPNNFHYWAHTVTANVSRTNKCSPADFSVEGSPVTVGKAVAAGGTMTVTGLSVRLVATADVKCTHANVTLTYNAN